MEFDFDSALTRDEALEAMVRRWEFAHRVEEVAVAEASGRVLAEDCRSLHDLPRNRVSSFDGIAVRSGDFEEGMPDTSQWVQGVEFVRADTGDDFPDEFDTVIAIENVTFDEGGRMSIVPDLKFRKGSAVRRAGATMGRDELLYAAGTLLTPEDIAVLAAGGFATVPVIGKLRIAYVPTGSELVPVGVEPGRGQNVQTNSLMLGAHFARWGVDMIEYDIVPDDRMRLGAAIDTALAQADLVIVNGGSSRGSEDFNSELLRERASFFRHGIKAVPGRPIGLAVIGGKPAINVPGPMIATFLANDWLVQSLVCFYYGQPLPQRVRVSAVLDDAVGGRPGFEQLARLVVHDVGGVLHAASVSGSATLAENVRSVNAFLAVPASCRHEAGDVVDVELFGTVAR